MLKRTLIHYVLFAVFVGAATGALHQFAWNRPYHYLDAACLFLVFPGVFVYMGLTEQRRRTIVIVGIVMMLAYLYSWQAMYSVMQGRVRVHKDVILFWPLFTGVFIALSLFANFIRDKIKGVRNSQK